MKLYELKKGQKFRVLEPLATVPPGALPVTSNDVILFDHVDGMYSFCTLGDKIVHVAAWTEVEVVPP